MSVRVSINLVVRNGEKYIRHCLDAINNQTYPGEFLQLNILDNGSTDNTHEVINNFNFKVSNFKLIEIDNNLGMWPGQEELLKHSEGKYVLAMAVDVLLDKNFIANAVKRMESDGSVGALEAKIYRYEILNGNIQKTNYIDTCGFQMFKSRRVINIGHGQEDRDQFGKKYEEIFGVEGAAPFFRRDALEDCRIKGELIDKDFFWYGDDLDLAWRMRLFGWKEVFDPQVVAWHDRQTTKTLKKSFADFVRLRRAIPIKKRGLDWRNTRWTIIKNDYIINIL